VSYPPRPSRRILFGGSHGVVTYDESPKPGTAREIFRKWFEDQLDREFRRRHLASIPVDSPVPSGSSPEMIATVATVPGRSRSETEASFIASNTIEKADLDISVAVLARLIERRIADGAPE
jgi:hypothetical protein